MKPQRMKDFVMGAVTASLVVGAAPAAFAKVASMTIPIQYNNIKVLVDGTELQTEKEPFIYDGTTYLPLRAVAEAVGKEVSWDSATKTASLSGGTSAPAEDVSEEPKQEEPAETEQKTDRWIRVTSKKSAQGGSVEIKCTDIRENLETGMLEFELKLDNTGYSNYRVWGEQCKINGKLVPFIRNETNGWSALAFSNRKAEEIFKVELSDLDAADIGKIYTVEISFYGVNVEGGKGFPSDNLVINFKS